MEWTFIKYLEVNISENSTSKTKWDPANDILKSISYLKWLTHPKYLVV